MTSAKIQMEVLTVRAGMRLWPGDHVGQLPDGRYGYLHPTRLLGIVNPFLEGGVGADEEFELWFYPQEDEG